jgi:hypothetical protein
LFVSLCVWCERELCTLWHLQEKKMRSYQQAEGRSCIHDHEGSIIIIVQFVLSCRVNCDS